MHPVHAPGYSDFFASGFRVVSRSVVLESLYKRAPSPKPIPLSFDSVLSDTDSEDESSKRRSRRTSIFSPLSKPKSVSTSESLRGSSRASKPKKHHRSASLISNFFGRRQSRQTAATAHVMSNDESGWLSSASSVSPVDDDIDFMDLSTWPECPRGGLECNSRATGELNSEPEILDPFSSSPSSKSFFVDFNLSSNVSAEEAIPTRRSRPVSMSSWSNRFSFSSISSASSSSFFSSSRRNSLSIRPSSFLSTSTSSRSPPADISFLHLPRVPKTNKGSSVERKRPASVHIMTTTSVSSPQASIFATATTTTQMAPPIKTTRRHSQIDVLYSSSVQPPRTESHTRSRSPQLSQPQTRSSRVRSLLPSPKSPSISAPIPEDKCDNNIWTPQNEAGTRSSSCGASSVVPSLNFISIASLVSQVPNRVLEVDDESDDIVVEREHDNDEELQASVIVGLDEEEAPSSASDARVFFGSEMEDDVPKRVDWREFCIEVLDGHSDA